MTVGGVTPAREGRWGEVYEAVEWGVWSLLEVEKLRSAEHLKDGEFDTLFCWHWRCILPEKVLQLRKIKNDYRPITFQCK